MLLNNTIDYTFQLEGFEGPLDLLLRLIERAELDITSIALAQVTDEYLGHVRAMQTPDPAALSSFLLIAARLLLIKSRALLPRPPAPSSVEQPDDAEQLVRQLQEYQRYKQAAGLLRSWEEQGRRSYVRVAAPALPKLEAPTTLDVTLAEMIATIQRRMQLQLPLDEQAVALPAPKLLTVRDVSMLIHSRLLQQQWLSFEDLLPLSVRRVELLVTLWAVLEMLKRQSIIAEQQELFGPIMLSRGSAFQEVLSFEF